ncbi:MAG: hypothetical protein Q4E77_03485 [Conchiformibius sp.]|nr:hypothetical protein [Conchiformibius sp.]
MFIGIKTIWKTAMHTLLKRLSIIQSAIALGDHELIEMQLAPVRRFADACTDVSVCEALQQISDALVQGRFADAEQAISQFLQSQHQLTVYQDGEWQALKMEAAALEKQLAELQRQKEERISGIEAFNHQYHQHLGELLEQILALHEQLAKQQMEAAQQAAQRQREAEEAFRRARQAFEDFQAESERQAQYEPPTDELDEEEQKRLKKAYREASRLCHPDMMGEKVKHQAAALLKTVAAARHSRDWANLEQALSVLPSDGEGLDADGQKLLKAFQRLHESLHQQDDERTDALLSAWQQRGIFNSETPEYQKCIQGLAACLQRRNTEIFQQLSEAYRQNDLAAVESILVQLQTNGQFAEDNSLQRDKRDKEQLRRYIAHLRECIAKLENELAELAEDETYQLIESLAGDYDDYFAETAAALEAEIAELSARLAQATA